MPRLRPVLAAAALALAAACAPRTADEAAPGAPASEDDGPVAGLVTSLQVEPYAPDSVRLVLHVTNAGAAPLPVVFPSGQTYDFAVAQGGRELWRWSAEMGFTQAVREETWPAGESRTYAETWRLPAGVSGELTATARLASSSHPAGASAVFRLP